MTFEQQTKVYQSYVAQYLSTWLAGFSQEPQKILYESMGYSLLAGGKRLRPILAMEFGRMCGGDWQAAAPLGCAVEMIHTYSLIHDDLPTMDNDDFRRGRPTNHKVYGEGMALLAGDALLTDAFALAASASLTNGNTGRAVSLLSQCAGSRGMVGGQVLDILSQQRQLTEEEVLAIQSRKTGCLIQAACVLGAMAGGATPEQEKAARDFADNLGLAFQIRDDILDVIGTQEEMGKGVGTDSEKNTFVRLYGLETCGQLVNTYTAAAIDALKIFPDHGYLKELAESLTQRRT